MAGEIHYCHDKKEQQMIISQMTQKGYWLASVKGRTINGKNMRMLTFYENGLKNTTLSKDGQS